jgi:predicted transcriptional regulator
VNSNSAKSKPGRRDKFDIIARVIETCTSGAKKTNVMHKSNLSFYQLNHYIRVTLEYGLLAKQIDDEGKAILTATPKGLDFLRKYDKILQILASERTRSPLV